MQGLDRFSFGDNYNLWDRENVSNDYGHQDVQDDPIPQGVEKITSQCSLSAFALFQAECQKFKEKEFFVQREPLQNHASAIFPNANSIQAKAPAASIKRGRATISCGEEAEEKKVTRGSLLKKNKIEKEHNPRIKRELVPRIKQIKEVPIQEKIKQISHEVVEIPENSTTSPAVLNQSVLTTKLARKINVILAPYLFTHAVQHKPLQGFLENHLGLAEPQRAEELASQYIEDIVRKVTGTVLAEEKRLKDTIKNLKEENQALRSRLEN